MFEICNANIRHLPYKPTFTAVTCTTPFTSPQITNECQSNLSLSTSVKLSVYLGLSLRIMGGSSLRLPCMAFLSLYCGAPIDQQ